MTVHSSPTMSPPLVLLRRRLALASFCLFASLSFWATAWGQTAPATPPPASAVVIASGPVAGSETIRVTVGFANQTVQTEIQVPHLVEKHGGEWVTSETAEVRAAHAAPPPGQKTWSPNTYLPRSIPARPGQPDGIAQSRTFPVPFGQPAGEAAPPTGAGPTGPSGPTGPTTKQEAIEAFLARRPDIVRFIQDNTGIRDPQKILEKWVYDVMRSEDKDWAEAKAILEKNW